MRLILGAGKYERPEGYKYLDVLPFEGIDFVHNLNTAPYPFEDNSVTEIIANHVVEHLDSLLIFMDECHRILQPGGSLYIQTPEAGSNPDLQFSDPTHVRCYRKHTFINYFTLNEAPKFGYTTKYWSIWHLEVKDNCIKFHGQPIK